MVVLTCPQREDIKGPIIFLAGPIQGARDWQADAVRHILSYAPDMHVANPRRPDKFKGEFGKALYAEQVDWETEYLRKAGEEGCVLFWMAREAEHNCGRAYAQTTRFEFAEWKMRHEFLGSNIAVGIEDGYTGAKYIRRRMGQDCPDVPILSSLEETCRQAVDLLKKS